MFSLYVRNMNAARAAIGPRLGVLSVLCVVNWFVFL